MVCASAYLPVLLFCRQLGILFFLWTNSMVDYQIPVLPEFRSAAACSVGAKTPCQPCVDSKRGIGLANWPFSVFL